jgi:hypothetical protein
MIRRRSGLQGDVLSLYRNVLREAKKKDDATLAFAKAKFRNEAQSVGRSDFKQVEFLLRQGHKRLKVLAMPGVKSAGMAARAFSTSAAPNAAPKWDVQSKPRAHIVSLGCGRNWVDSEVMLGDFLRAGYEIEASDASEASLLVVNTCGFLGKARAEVRVPPQ